MSAIEGEYEVGDINTIADDEVDEFDEDDAEVYVAGDINAVGVAESDSDDMDDEDIDDIDDIGNRSEGATSVSVLTYLARALADEPDSVVVQVDEHRGAKRLRLHVAPEDMGRVIGRRGRTAQAIRTLVGVAGSRDGIQTSVDIVDQ